MLKYQIINNFETTTAQTFTVSGGTSNVLYKSLVIPISTQVLPVDYGEDLQDIVLNERLEAIGKPLDGETIKYIFNNNLANQNNGLVVKFRFWDENNGFTTSYSAADFTTTDIRKNTNGFKKSFFRLYFYDSSSAETRNLIFTEDFNLTNKSDDAIFTFNRLYWLRNDDFFIKNNVDRTVYMEARFFNAKTGKSNKFINPFPLPTTPMSILDYNDYNKRDWRCSAIIIQNPKLNNGMYNFYPKTPYGANTVDTITLTESILL